MLHVGRMRLCLWATSKQILKTRLVRLSTLFQVKKLNFYLLLMKITATLINNITKDLFQSQGQENRRKTREGQEKN